MPFSHPSGHLLGVQQLFATDFSSAQLINAGQPAQRVIAPASFMDQKALFGQQPFHDADFLLQQRGPSLVVPTQSPCTTNQESLITLPPLLANTSKNGLLNGMTLGDLVASNKCPDITITAPEKDDAHLVPRSPSFNTVGRRLSDTSSATDEDLLGTLSVDDLLSSPSWLYQDDCQPNTPAASPSMLPATPNVDDQLFPDHVLYMNNRELKKWLRAQNLSEEEQAHIKKQRRRLMNRVYAKRARDKKSLEEVNGGGMCPAQMQAKITRLQAEVDGLRAVQAQLVKIMNTRCPDALVSISLGK